MREKWVHSLKFKIVRVYRTLLVIPLGKSGFGDEKKGIYFNSLESHLQFRGRRFRRSWAAVGPWAVRPSGGHIS